MIHDSHNERGNTHALDWALLPDKSLYVCFAGDWKRTKPEKGEERPTGRGSLTVPPLALGQKLTWKQKLGKNEVALRVTHTCT